MIGLHESKACLANRCDDCTDGSCDCRHHYDPDWYLADPPARKAESMKVDTSWVREDCGLVTLSGLKCIMPQGHEGYHFDGFGLRDPEPEAGGSGVE